LGAELLHADGQTDSEMDRQRRRDMMMIAFPSFVKAPRKEHFC